MPMYVIVLPGENGFKPAFFANACVRKSLQSPPMRVSGRLPWVVLAAVAGIGAGILSA